MGKTTTGEFKTYTIANLPIETRLKIKLLAFAHKTSVSNTIVMAIDLFWEQNSNKTLGDTLSPLKIKETMHGILHETRGRYKVKKEAK